MYTADHSQAFLDESFHEAPTGGFYVLAAEMFEPGSHDLVRATMRGILGKRNTSKLHWNEMDSQQRRSAVKTVADLEGFHVVAVGTPVRGFGCRKLHSFEWIIARGPTSHCSGRLTSLLVRSGPIGRATEPISHSWRNASTRSRSRPVAELTLGMRKARVPVCPRCTWPCDSHPTRGEVLISSIPEIRMDSHVTR